jgi:hypothetical protein
VHRGIKEEDIIHRVIARSGSAIGFTITVAIPHRNPSGNRALEIFMEAMASGTRGREDGAKASMVRGANNALPAPTSDLFRNSQRSISLGTPQQMKIALPAYRREIILSTPACGVAKVSGNDSFLVLLTMDVERSVPNPVFRPVDDACLRI